MLAGGTRWRSRGRW